MQGFKNTATTYNNSTFVAYGNKNDTQKRYEMKYVAKSDEIADVGSDINKISWMLPQTDSEDIEELN